MHTIQGNGSSLEILGRESSNSTSIHLDEDAGKEYVIVLPVIVLFGICGNIISVVTILNTRLRKIPANQYLIVLTASDSVFLLGMIMIVFKLDFWTYASCLIVEYTLMTSSYISSWTIVALTIERYIAIAHPMRHVKLSHIPRTRIMRYWVPIPFVLNLVQFVTLTPPSKDNPHWPDVRKCGLSPGRLQMFTEISDVFLSYIGPCVVVILLNSIVASTVRQAGKGIFGSDVDTGDSHERLEARTSQRRTGNTNSGSARILFVVPLVYTILNTPFYFTRIVDTFAMNLFNNMELFFSKELGQFNKFGVFFYNASHYLYYANFASDFLVYAFSSRNFRKSVCLAWSKLLCPASWQAQSKFLRRTEMGSQRTCMIPSQVRISKMTGDPV